MTRNIKNTHGGKRVGAGRKPKNVVKIEIPETMLTLGENPHVAAHDVMRRAFTATHEVINTLGGSMPHQRAVEHGLRTEALSAMKSFSALLDYPEYKSNHGSDLLAMFALAAGNLNGKLDPDQNEGINNMRGTLAEFLRRISVDAGDIDLVVNHFADAATKRCVEAYRTFLHKKNTSSDIDINNFVFTEFDVMRIFGIDYWASSSFPLGLDKGLAVLNGHVIGDVFSGVSLDSVKHTARCNGIKLMVWG